MPFKRESISKANLRQFDTVASVSFNSLQTGKYIQRTMTVSPWVFTLMFQFPSNGKVYPKQPRLSERLILEPGFQFPSNGKAYPKLKSKSSKLIGRPCFNSLQTGKHIQSFRTAWGRNSKRIQFQFPSNGKAYPKVITSFRSSGEILFQFPSNGKAYPKMRLTIWNCRISMCFNSLQTGKHIQRPNLRTLKSPTSSFQFPSNGKVYPKNRS